MNNHIKGIYFFISFFSHMVVVVAFLFFSRDATFQKNFIVLGIHSQKPSKAFYRSTRYTTSATVKNSGKKTRAVTGIKKEFFKTGQKKVSVRQKKTVESRVRKNTNSHQSDQLTPLVKKTTMIEEKKALNDKQKKKKKKQVKVQQKKSVKEKKQKKLVKKVEQKTRKLLKKSQPEIKQPEVIESDNKDIKAIDPLDHTKTATVYLAQAVEQDKSQQDEVLEFSTDQFSDVRLKGYYEHIQKEVNRLWRPPFGVPKGTECTLSFAISNDGKVDKFDIIKRSKMLIYDLSILRVAQHFCFDQCLWGKRFTIDFRQ